MTPVQEFTSATAIRQHYLETRKRLFRPLSRPALAPTISATPVEELVDNGECGTTGDNEQEIVRPTLHALLSRVAMKHGLTVTEVISASRNKRLVIARQEYFYLALTETLHSYPVIAKHCGNRDHSTAIYGVRMHCIMNDLPLPRGGAISDLHNKKITAAVAARRALNGRS